jgi:hypothetical protein
MAGLLMFPLSLLSLAFGVGHIFTIDPNWIVLRVYSAGYPISLALCAVGVGHICTAPAMFNPCFPAITLGLLWLAPPLTMLQVGVGK